MLSATGIALLFRHRGMARPNTTPESRKNKQNVTENPKAADKNE